MRLPFSSGTKTWRLQLFYWPSRKSFSDPVLSALDEYGIPFPLAKRLEGILGTQGDLSDAALDILRKLDTSGLNITSFEKSLLDEAREYL